MLARLIDLFSFGVKLPLLWYLILFVVISAGIVWFGFIYQDQGKDLKQTEEALADACKELDAQDKELTAKDEELDELNHNYATVALLLEDQHSAIIDLQQQVELHNERMDILSDRLNQQRDLLTQRPHFHLFVKQVESDYTGPDECEEDEEEPFPEPSPDWIKDVKGLDTL